MEIIWLDDDLVQVRVHSSNGRFAGTANCYTEHETVAGLSEAIRGFPASIEDRRGFELGTFDLGFAGGGFRLGLRCMDRAGHVAADVEFRSAPEDSTGGRDETARFSFATEAAAIDAFAASLGRMEVAVGAAAELRKAT